MCGGGVSARLLGQRRRSAGHVTAAWMMRRRYKRRYGDIEILRHGWPATEGGGQASLLLHCWRPPTHMHPACWELDDHMTKHSDDYFWRANEWMMNVEKVHSFLYGIKSMTKAYQTKQIRPDQTRPDVRTVLHTIIEYSRE